MTQTDVERQFRRFQRSADPRAIGAVYDAIAPHLLMLAAHFGHRGSDAEDTVQATFLTAIEHAHEYDGRRPLMPWMIGILVNQVRGERRKRARRPDPDRLELPRDIDPADAAETAEFLERVERIIRKFPTPYRQALSLRVIHELTPTEIAHTLGVSHDTVKTRLRRGRDLLRRALPAGVMPATALLLLTPADGLAASRVVVLEFARSFGRPWRDGALAMGLPRALLLTVTLSLTAFVLAGFTPVDAPPLVDRPTATQDAPSALARVAHDPVDRAVLSNASDTPLRPRVDVVWHDGTPAREVWVSATPTQGSNPRLAERWARTDARGRVRFDTIPSGTYRLATARGGTTETRWAAGRAGSKLTIPRGVTLRGRVHVGGRPVAGARIWVSRRGLVEDGQTATVTRRDGSYLLRDVEPGRAVTVIADGHPIAPLRQVFGASGTATTEDFELETDTDITLHGEVLDRDGRPIPDAIIQVGRSSHVKLHRDFLGEIGLVPPILLRSDARGRFSTTNATASPTDVWVRAAGFAPHHARVEFERIHHVSLVLDATHAVTGRATDSSGIAVPGVRIVGEDRIASLPGAPRWMRSECTSDASGRFALDLPGGSRVLHATSADERFVEHTLDPASERVWNPVLVRAPRITGRVTTTDDRPLEGFEIVVTESCRAPTPRIESTDEDGEFAIRAHRNRTYSIHVRQAGSSWNGPVAARTGIRAPHHLEFRIDPDRLVARDLIGWVVDPHGNPSFAGVQLSALADGRAYVKTDPDDGRFRFRALPRHAAGYAAKIQSLDGQFAAIAGPFFVSADQPLDVGVISLRTTGRFEAQVLVAGRPCPPCGASIETSAGLLVEQHLGVKDGRLRTSRLPSGTYVAHFTGGQTPQAAMPFRIDAGRTICATWSLDAGHVRTFVIDHAPTTTNVVVQLEWYDAHGNRRCRDRFTWLQPQRLVQRFEAGRYRLVARSSAGCYAEAWFESSAADADPIELDLR